MSIEEYLFNQLISTLTGLYISLKKLRVLKSQSTFPLEPDETLQKWMAKLRELTEEIFIKNLKFAN